VLAESLSNLRCQFGIRLDRDHAVTLVQIVGRIVTVVHSDVEDQVSLHDCRLSGNEELRTEGTFSA